ncbi:hypothetical protein JTE90_026539 [Oedothorax gibbosus]|uniref:Uncharacterized protein n=1 Tax=Oedothorax gibbosus TaxID=931172 RepID=A0AAV6VQZ5_9ARAC|nr:hypothetical protein JTE90_026539 [Oedothorax gibbosus]
MVFLERCLCAADGKEGEVDVNFYNFAREEPSAFMFDISSCYDDSLSKTFVLTFPVKEELKGYEKIIKSSIHLFLKDVIKVSKQRIFVTEVIFDSKYMYAEFKLLAPPDSLIKLKTPTKESTLDEAVNKLKESISYGNFTISIPINEKVLVLKLEPNGLNEFAGDRHPATVRANYNEGSVIGLTIGMLLLGFVLGGDTRDPAIETYNESSTSMASKKKNKTAEEIDGVKPSGYMDDSGHIQVRNKPVPLTAPAKPYSKNPDSLEHLKECS